MTKTSCVLLFMIVFLSCDNESNFVQTEFAHAIEVEGKLQEKSILILGDESTFVKTFSKRRDNTLNLYSKLQSVEYDFEMYDYLFSFGKKIARLEYSKRLSKMNDFCGYLEKTPVFPIYGETGNFVFIYKIPEKNLYRNKCP